MNTCYQDWEPVVIKSTNAVKMKNKELQQTVEKPMGNKEFQRLNNEELPAFAC